MSGTPGPMMSPQPGEDSMGYGIAGMNGSGYSGVGVSCWQQFSDPVETLHLLILPYLTSFILILILAPYIILYDWHYYCYTSTLFLLYWHCYSFLSLSSVFGYVLLLYLLFSLSIFLLSYLVFLLYWHCYSFSIYSICVCFFFYTGTATISLSLSFSSSLLPLLTLHLLPSTLSPFTLHTDILALPAHQSVFHLRLRNVCFICVTMAASTHQKRRRRRGERLIMCWYYFYSWLCCGLIIVLCFQTSDWIYV